MAFRSRELLNKIIHKMGPDSMSPGVKESLKKDLPNSKIVMGRAKRGIYAGKHIQFGNKVSEDGGNKHSEVVFLQLQMRNLDPQIILRTRRTWKPNVQEKRLFSYILDRHIRVKVTTYALRCIDKAGGIDEYLLKTPYHKMDTEMGLFWKAKIEKMYEELGMMEVGFFPPEEEAKLEEGFKQLKIAKREFRREARRKASEASGNQKQISEGNADDELADDEKPAELEVAAA